MAEWNGKADINNLDAVTEFVDDELRSFSCSDKTVMLINVAIDEIFSNIVRYAYKDSEGEVRVEVESQDDGNITVIFTDYGIPFNPLESEDPDVTLSAEERSVGGLGIYLVKKSMDEVSYEYSENRNILTIRKSV